MAPTVPLPSHLKAKTSLIWVKTASEIYGRLSFNVLREVCMFIAFTPRFALAGETAVVLVDLITRRSSRLQYQHIALSNRFLKGGSCAYMGDSQVFLCGGRGNYKKEACYLAATQVVSPAITVQLQDMRRARVSHALYYNEGSRQVFAFGGMAEKSGWSSCCEQYDFATDSWSRLRNMSESRVDVGACGYQGQVYLYGNDRLPLEVFSIASKKFATLPAVLDGIDRNLNYVSYPFIVAMEGQLIVAKRESWDSATCTLRRWDLKTQMTLGESKFKFVRSQVAVLAANDTLFALNKAGCTAFDLNTMNVSAHIRSNVDLIL